ncbi:TPA: HAD-IIB family hydrolase [Streptococcus suis]|nr:HAD-IIB family hydrolase [Streptococcus suis]HEM3648543.1 HAD-IIB family hydrolase [Streptococcus suis]
MRKIIFLDVDGTLVDYHNRIPESAIRAIRQARENGHLVYVCTGRSRAEMQPELWEIGLDGMIGGNGSYVEHQDQVIMHQLLSEEDSRAIVDWLHERGLEFYLESNNGLFASENFRERARETLRIYSMNKGKTAEEVATQEVEDVMHGMIFDGQLYRNDLNKVSFVLDSYQDHLDSKQAFPQLVANTWGGRGESALFGDAKIDISMLDYCAVGVAMGNGGAEILAIADMITDDVEEDGLYNAFERLGLLDK